MTPQPQGSGRRRGLPWTQRSSLLTLCLPPSPFPQGLKQSLTASGQWPQAWGALDAALRNKLQQLYQL